MRNSPNRWKIWQSTDRIGQSVVSNLYSWIRSRKSLIKADLEGKVTVSEFTQVLDASIADKEKAETKFRQIKLQALLNIHPLNAVEITKYSSVFKDGTFHKKDSTNIHKEIDLYYIIRSDIKNAVNAFMIPYNNMKNNNVVDFAELDAKFNAAKSLVALAKPKFKTLIRKYNSVDVYREYWDDFLAVIENLINGKRFTDAYPIIRKLNGIDSAKLDSDLSAVKSSKLGLCYHIKSIFWLKNCGPRKVTLQIFNPQKRILTLRNKFETLNNFRPHSIGVVSKNPDVNSFEKAVLGNTAPDSLAVATANMNKLLGEGEFAEVKIILNGMSEAFVWLGFLITWH